MDLHCKPMTGFTIHPHHLRGTYMRRVEYYREDNSNESRTTYEIVYHFLGFSIWPLE